ncbi:hypothetical protein [Prevotella marseillensis]|uniref:hypothetical protein n=1 Tax=Prevotella marseillensis TaxID=2479840 RepID=UPI0019D30741|nr:hypothetical protein [Prevotella marseillensis]
MIIYNDKGKKLLEIEVDDNSYRHRVIMGDYNLTLYYSLAEHVELPVGCYCDYQGERFTLERPEAFKMKHSRSFEYTVTMESSQAKAKIWKFRNPVDGRLKFSLTAKPHEHLQMFVDNMNRRDTGWAVGSCVSGDEVCISYSHAFCYEALEQMASTLNTEFEFNGKTVSLRKVEYNKNNPLPLSYGRGNGFKPNVGRSNYGETPPTEILYVQGGSDNIDPSKYGSSELLLPKSQSIGFDGVYFEDEEGFNADNARYYMTDDLGFSIRRKDKDLTSLAESSLDCSDIYPKHVGEISSVVCVDKDKNFYDIIDNSIPENLDYEKCLIDGETMTVIFQTGMLAGKEFEVKYYHNSILNPDGSLKKAARRFEITPQEIDGQTMPNETFCPRANEKYAVFKCMLPDAYICNNATKSGASWDMFRQAVKSLFDNEETKFTFTGDLDGIWAKKDWLNIGGRIKLGGYIKFSDERFQKDGVLVRITGIKDYINKPHSPSLELSNETKSASFSSKLKQLESEEVVIEDNHREAIQFTKRRFRDAKETMSMLEASLLENFTQSISPIAIQTMQMLVGDESLQFRFVSSKTNPTQVSHTINYDQETKTLKAAAGLIQHLTLGVSSLSSSHKPEEYLYWNVEEFESARLEDGSKKYYLYAKVSKTTDKGVFFLSESAKTLNGVDGHYCLLVGVLNSEYNGERSFATLYGFTEILPGRVTTDRVVSGDGNSYFDMFANAMKLGDALDFNSAGDGKLRIKGTIVQSQSGQESYIGCYRGEYNASYTYYNGDEVTFTKDGNTSTYRMFSDTPVNGIEPTNTLYWQVVAQGSKGADGTSVKIKGQAYAHYSTMEEWDQDRRKPVVLIDKYTLTSGETTEDKYCVVKKLGRPFAGAAEGWMTVYAEVGDAYIMNSDDVALNGCMYVAQTDKWQNVGQIKGDKGDTGQEGAAGKFTELRYAKNGSTTTPPALSKSSLNPSGWTTEVPTVASLEYLWQTTAVKSGDGKTLLSQWSIPVRVTPYNGIDGQDGADGKDGTNGRGIVSITEMYLATNLSTGVTKNTIGWSSFVQDISASRPYLYNYEIIKYSDNTTEETDVALIGRWGMDGENGQDGASPAPVFRGDYSSTKYYYGNPHRVDIVKYNSVYYVARIDAPSGSGGFVGQAPTNTNYWNPFGASFESVATQLLLAENANIAGWVFRNGKLYSQNNSCYLDGKTGDVNIQGNFTGKISTVNAGNRIVIDPSSNSIIIYNHIGGKDIEIMRIEAEDIGFGLRRPKITMNELSTETGGDIMNKLIVSAFEIGLYRNETGGNLVPMFQVTGGWSTKKIILSDYVLPSSKPSTKGQIYRNGDTLKIVT